MLNIEELFEARQDLKKRDYHKKPVSIITHEDFLKTFYYDAEHGKFFKRLNGDISIVEAGSVDICGYRRLNINHKRYYAHVLAVFYMTGKWPSGPVDHINRDKSDNRWKNLREVTYSQNALNRCPKNLRGIRKTRNKITRWEAAITIEGVRYHLGTFDSEDEAKNWYIDFVKEKGLSQFVIG